MSSRRVVVALHCALIVGLWVLWFRYQSSLRASADYDGLFDGLSIYRVAGEVGFVTVVIAVSILIWWRTGFGWPLLFVDVALVLALGWTVVTMLATRGGLTVGRWLALANVIIAVLGAVALWRQRPGASADAGGKTSGPGDR
jgi:hypothetical protein